MMGREARLSNDYQDLVRLRSESSLIDFIGTKGDPPEEYHIFYRCGGLSARGEVAYNHVAELQLVAGYPDLPPKVYVLTKIYHPNIVRPLNTPSIQRTIQQALDMAQIPLERQAVLREFSKIEGLFKAQVCLDILKLEWTASRTLDQVVIELGHMIQYKLYNVDDPLDWDAANWAKENPHLFPIDRRSLHDLGGFDITIISQDE